MTLLGGMRLCHVLVLSWIARDLITSSPPFCFLVYLFYLAVVIMDLAWPDKPSAFFFFFFYIKAKTSIKN